MAAPPQPPPDRSLFASAARVLPGVIAGAADLDPAAVLTATVAGASFGYSLGWVVLLSVPVLFSVFAVASRIGRTGKGLIQLIRDHYGRKTAVVVALLVAAVNLTMIVGDIMAVSESFSLVTVFPRVYFLAVIGFVVWYILIIGSYQKTTKVLGTLTLILVAYAVAAFHVTDSFTRLAHEVLVPRIQLNSSYMMGVIAVFGSLLTPDVIVWQTSSRRGLPQGVAQAHISEPHAGTFVACMISLCAMVAASHLHVPNPSAMSIRSAADALETFGYLGPMLFSIGIIGSGLIALPVLVASLCFSIAEAFGWKSGLAFVPWDARLFYVMISVTVFLAVSIDMFGINTVSVLYWSQALAGMVLVPIFAYILLLSNNPAVMHHLNSRWENIWLSFATTAMLISNILFLWTLIVG